MQEVNRSTCNSKVTEAKDQKYGYSGWTACFSINVVFNKFTTLYFLSWECQKRCKSSQSSLLVLSNSQPQERVGGWASPPAARADRHLPHSRCLHWAAARTWKHDSRCFGFRVASLQQRRGWQLLSGLGQAAKPVVADNCQDGTAPPSAALHLRDDN